MINRPDISHPTLPASSLPVVLGPAALGSRTSHKLHFETMALPDHRRGRCRVRWEPQWLALSSMVELRGDSGERVHRHEGEDRVGLGAGGLVRFALKEVCERMKAACRVKVIA